MAVDRELPGDEARELLALVRELAATELAPRAAEFEERAEFPREVFRTLGRAGLLGLAYPEDVGGGDQPYVVYLQVLEELASAWAAVALGISVHTLSCHPLAMFGTDEQKKRWLPDMLGGELLGAYCLSEANAGSDAGSLQARRRRDGDRYLLDGTKAWVTHGGVADYYDVFCRTCDDRRHGHGGGGGPVDVPVGRATSRCRQALRPAGVEGQAVRDGHRHEDHDRRRTGARRLRLHHRLPGRALHARGEGHADLRGDQPDPADGHRKAPGL